MIASEKEHPEEVAGDDKPAVGPEDPRNRQEKGLLLWLKNRDGSRLYQTADRRAQWFKAVGQMLIGIGTVLAIIVLVWIPGLRNSGVANLALRIVGVGLALAAVIELTYTFFTDGPDEALDPVILGLSSFILIKISDPKTRLSVTNASTIILLVVALAGLFILRKVFIKPSDTGQKARGTER